MKKKDVKILVVDDEDIMRSLFADILQDEGYNVTTVSNGMEAIDKTKEIFFNIAFIDVHMPQMNGIQTLHEVRESSPETAVVMTDSFPMDVLNDLKKEGITLCINKPFNIQEIRSVIEDILHKYGGKNA